MLIESIVRFTLKIKDHRVVSTRLTNNELRIELNVKKGRKLPCSICGERCRQKDKLDQRCWRQSRCGVLLCFSSNPPDGLTVLNMELR